MDTIYLDDFLDEGILKEKSFREKVKSTDWNQYKNKRVLIKGCTDIPVPTWPILLLQLTYLKLLKESTLVNYVQQLKFTLKSKVKNDGYKS